MTYKMSIILYMMKTLKSRGNVKFKKIYISKKTSHIDSLNANNYDMHGKIKVLD